jgi:hypothetical protein
MQQAVQAVPLMQMLLAHQVHQTQVKAAVVQMEMSLTQQANQVVVADQEL